MRDSLVPTVCYACGRIGHVEKRCVEEDKSSPSQTKYGPWIRANSPSFSSRQCSSWEEGLGGKGVAVAPGTYVAGDFARAGRRKVMTAAQKLGRQVRIQRAMTMTWQGQSWQLVAQYPRIELENQKKEKEAGQNNTGIESQVDGSQKGGGQMEREGICKKGNNQSLGQAEIIVTRKGKTSEVESSARLEVGETEDTIPGSTNKNMQSELDITGMQIELMKIDALGQGPYQEGFVRRRVFMGQMGETQKKLKLG